MDLTGIWAPLDGSERKVPDDHSDTEAMAVDESQRPAVPAEQATVSSSAAGALTCSAAVRLGGGKEVVEVLDVDTHGDAVAAALSSGEVRLFSAAGDRLAPAGALRGHPGPVTAVDFSQPELLVTIASDGVREFQLQPGGQTNVTHAAPRYVDPKGKEIFSAAVSPDGALLAAGGDGRLLLWERPSGKLLAAFDDTHDGPIAQVVWVPHAKATLISASDDGMVSVMDFAEVVDEEDSYKASLNLEGAVARMGFYGAKGDKLWMCSQLCGLHLWEWAAACSEDAAGGEGTLADNQDARGDLAAATASAAQPSRSGPPANYDYLLTCRYDGRAQQLQLAAGTADGGAAVFPVREPTGDGAAAHIGPPAAWLTGSHTDMLRGAAWLSASEAWTLVSGGEDGQLCLWTAQPAVGQDEGAARRRSGIRPEVRPPVPGCSGRGRCRWDVAG